jgi:hypothetical protein
MSRRLITVVTLAAAACGAQASPALALDQLVSGTTLSTLALTAATPATFGTTLAPGATSNSTGGTLVATSTSPSWALQVKDQAVGAPGHLVAAGVGCTGSAANLANAVTVTVTPAVANGSITSTGSQTVTGSNVGVLSAANVLLAATTFNTAYQQVVGSSELLTAGCVYSHTATYTIQ